MFLHALARLSLQKPLETREIDRNRLCSEVSRGKQLPLEIATWAAQNYPSGRAILETRMGRSFDENLKLLDAHTLGATVNRLAGPRV